MEVSKIVIPSHSGAKTKPSTLPPLGQASSQAKRKTKSLTKVQSETYYQPMVVTTYQPREPEDSHLKDKLNSRKIQAKVRFMRSMVRNQRTSLLEMRQHKFFLRKLCDKLVRAIQDTEDSTALRVRAMLQQQDALTVSPPIAPSPERIPELKSLQVEQLNAEVEKTQEEVNFLSTYMDHEYPVRSLQIANLARQLQQAKDDQQDELDNLAEMRRMVLELLSAKIWKKKEKILSSLAMVSGQLLWGVSGSHPSPAAFPVLSSSTPDPQPSAAALEEVPRAQASSLPTENPAAP
uniref:Uncharacterized protein n=1 Tax=Spermophilus dauricus TaxID=99837 RepID=A0A8C9PH53_SPEDA